MCLGKYRKSRCLSQNDECRIFGVVNNAEFSALSITRLIANTSTLSVLHQPASDQLSLLITVPPSLESQGRFSALLRESPLPLESQGQQRVGTISLPFRPADLQDAFAPQRCGPNSSQPADLLLSSEVQVASKLSTASKGVLIVHPPSCRASPEKEAMLSEALRIKRAAKGRGNLPTLHPFRSEGHHSSQPALL